MSSFNNSILKTPRVCQEHAGYVYLSYINSEMSNKIRQEQYTIHFDNIPIGNTRWIEDVKF